MSLKNLHYDKIMRQYDEKRMQHAYELKLRTEEVHNKVPEIKALEDKIAEESVHSGKMAILGNKSALIDLENKINELAEKKNELLIQAGYPADYLELHYTCDKCKDTGFIGKEYCSCFNAEVSALIYEDSNINDIIKYENFDHFNIDCYSDDSEDYDNDLEATPREHMTTVVHMLERFIETFDDDYTNLLIYGETGLGKTFLSNCVAKELLDSAHSVCYYNSYSLFTMMENYKFRFTEYERLSTGQFDNLFECDLLIIDDLGSEQNTSFITSSLFTILNERSSRHKSTIITTNLTPSSIGSTYGERILSRITKDYEFIKLIGHDIRTL